MQSLLPQIGYDLAAKVEEERQNMVEISNSKIFVKSRRSSAEPLLDFLLLHLRSPMNSMFLVDSDLSYVNRFISSLALFMQDAEAMTNKLLQLVEVYKLETSYTFSERYTPDDFKKAMLKNVGKRLYAVDTLKLLTLGVSNEDWDMVVPRLTQETQKYGYFLVMDHIEELFNKNNVENHYLARHFFFLTRGNAQLTFIAPINWDDYVNHIENGQFKNLIQHRRPIFFSPRPKHLIQSNTWDYDADYVYESEDNVTS